MSSPQDDPTGQPADDGSGSASVPTSRSRLRWRNALRRRNGSGGGRSDRRGARQPAAGPGSASHAGDEQSQSQRRRLAGRRRRGARRRPRVENEARLRRRSGCIGRFPDPTPPARRLEPRFARNARVGLAEPARRLGARARRRARARPSHVRAGHEGGSSEARRLAPAQLHAVAERVAGRARPRGPHELRGPGDRASELQPRRRPAGARPRARRLQGARCEDRVLSDRRIDIYAGGRSDIAAGRGSTSASSRCFATSRRRTAQVTVSCLQQRARAVLPPGCRLGAQLR